MKPNEQSKAGQAYEKGKIAALSGQSADSCPYLLGKYIHLKNWWMKGFNEVNGKKPRSP